MTEVIPHSKVLKEIRGFLQARAQVRALPGTILQKAFYLRHRPIGFSIAESVYSALIAQGYLFIHTFIFGAGPSAWVVPSGVAIAGMSTAIFVFFAPMTYAITNITTGFLVSRLAPHRPFGSDAPSATEVWMYFEGAYGFWGKVALALLSVMYINWSGVLQATPPNPAFFEDPDPMSVLLLIGLFGLPVFLLLLTWIWSGIVDGVFVMVHRYVDIIELNSSFGRKLIVWIWVLAALLVSRVIVGFFVLVATFTVSVAVATAAYQVGHAFRFFIGYEVVPFERITSLGMDALR